jgi:ADP-ribose pyrophosphatase
MSISKTVQDVDIIKRETIFDEYFQMIRYHVRHRKYDGGWSDELSREVFQRGAVTAVLPYDAKRDRLVLIEQFRAGAMAAIEDDNLFPTATSSPWLVEVVAGVVEEGEAPEDVARRELVEEAGCVALDMVHLYTCHATPGAVNEPLAIFCAHVDSENVAGIHGLDEEGEDIRVFTVSPDEAAEMLSSGQVLNSTTIIALQWFATNHDKLRKRWG